MKIDLLSKICPFLQVEMGKLRQGEADKCNEGCFGELWLSKEVSQHTVLTGASFLSGGKS